MTQPNTQTRPLEEKAPASGGEENARRASGVEVTPRPDESAAERQERLLDDAVEATFPASDPIAPAQFTGH